MSAREFPMPARAALIVYAATTRTVTADALTPLLDALDAEVTAKVRREDIALIEDRADDADFTEEPLYIVGLRSAADLLKAASSARTAGDEQPETERLRARVAELEQAAIEGRGALGALCYDLEDPGSNAFGALHMLSQATVATTTPRDDALAALARRDADKLDAAAESIVAACPDHGEEDEAWMDCHCVAAEELSRQASTVRKGGDPR